MNKAPVNKIIPSSVVDGPGNRTAIFFQSCNFNCRYCHNPETINMCISCGACVETCPVQALSFKDGKVDSKLLGKTVTLNLNVILDGNESSKINATVKLKLTIMK